MERRTFLSVAAATVAASRMSAATRLPIKKAVYESMLPEKLSYADRFKIARDAGYEQYLYFRGHGIGCATHDLPSFAPGNPKKLEENMVFCFEPMLVKYEFGTACWEDIWWVTSDRVERLNECPFRFW